MKLVTHKYFLMSLMTFFLAVAVSPLTAEVYKTVDKDGNVTYTDTPPPDGSQPIDLPPISVIEAPVYETGSKQTDEGEEKELSLRELRKNYKDFAIVAPQQEESVWHPETPITVTWNTKFNLQEGMMMTLFVDGVQQESTTVRSIPVSDLERGEHTLRAELRDAKNRKVASADPITFFVKKPNLYTNRLNARPRG